MFLIVPKVTLVELGLLQGVLGAFSVLFKVARFQVEGVAAVQVAVNWVTHVSSVNGGGEIVVQSKPVDALAQAVEVVVFR